MTKKKKLLNLKQETNELKLIHKPTVKINTNLNPPSKLDEKPSISLKYLDLGFKSFHDLRDGHNLKKIDTFVKKILASPNWSYVFNAYTKKPSDSAKSKRKIQSLGFDYTQIEMFHLRVSDKFRVHGFLIDYRFKLVWIDPNHEIDG